MKQRCLCQNLHRWVTQSIGIREYAGIRHWWVDGLIRERRNTDTCTLDGDLEKLHSAGWCASSVARGSNRQCNRSRAPGASLGLGSRRDQQGKRHLLSRANDAVLHNCHNGIWQRHIRAQTKLFFQSQTHRRVWLVPKVTGQAPHKLAPCPLGLYQVLTGSSILLVDLLPEQQWNICLADTATEGYIQAKRRVVEPLSGHPKAGGETYIENAPMLSGWSEPALWSLDIHLNVSSRCWYQQHRSDTGKLGAAQGM